MKTTTEKILAIIIIGLAVSSCTKKLPKEEQQRLQKEANERKIQRVTEGQMLEYVQQYGEQLQEMASEGSDPATVVMEMKELLGAHHEVEYDLPAQMNGNELQEIVQAYMFSIAEGSEPGANIQKLKSGNFLYTIPQITDSAGIKVLSGLWKIEFIRKDIVNEIAIVE